MDEAGWASSKDMAESASDRQMEMEGRRCQDLAGDESVLMKRDREWIVELRLPQARDVTTQEPVENFPTGKSFAGNSGFGSRSLPVWRPPGSRVGRVRSRRAAV